MRLYLDLNKASQNTGGTSTKSEEQSVASHKNSYVRTTSGVSGGSVGGYDKPEVGRDWSHGDDEKLDDEVEAARQARNKQAQERNLVPTEEETGMQKALAPNSMDMVKSLTARARQSLQLHDLTTTEVDFLKSIKGLTEEDIRRTQPLIVGKDRARFGAWLCERVTKSVDNFYRKK